MGTLPDNNERRPRTTGDAAQDRSATKLPDTAQSTDWAARARRHDYAVRVVSERRDGVLVTQIMTDLPAAERKRSRTLARGLRCELHLVCIVPVGVTPLPMVPTAEHLAELLGVTP